MNYLPEAEADIRPEADTSVHRNRMAGTEPLFKQPTARLAQHVYTLVIVQHAALIPGVKGKSFEMIS